MRGLIVGLVCVLWAFGICRGDEEKTGESALVTAWADKLSAKYFEGGDRLLVFEAVQPGKPPMRFRVADCQSRQFGAVQAGPEGQVGQAMGWFASGEGEPILEKMEETSWKDDPNVELPPILDPEVLVNLKAKELEVADWIRKVGGEALAMAIVMAGVDQAIDREVER